MKDEFDSVFYFMILFSLLCFLFLEVYVIHSNYIFIFVIIWICLGISIRRDGRKP